MFALLFIAIVASAAAHVTASHSPHNDTSQLVPHFVFPIYDQIDPLLGIVAVECDTLRDTRLEWRMYENIHQVSNRVLPYASLTDTTERAIYATLQWSGHAPPSQQQLLALQTNKDSTHFYQLDSRQNFGPCSPIEYEHQLYFFCAYRRELLSKEYPKKTWPRFMIAKAARTQNANVTSVALQPFSMITVEARLDEGRTMAQFVQSVVPFVEDGLLTVSLTLAPGRDTPGWETGSSVWFIAGMSSSMTTLTYLSRMTPSTPVVAPFPQIDEVGAPLRALYTHVVHAPGKRELFFARPRDNPIVYQLIQSSGFARSAAFNRTYAHAKRIGPVDVNPPCAPSNTCPSCTMCDQEGGYNRESRHWTAFQIVHIEPFLAHGVTSFRVNNGTHDFMRHVDVAHPGWNITALGSYEWNCGLGRVPSDADCIHGPYRGDFMQVFQYRVTGELLDHVELISQETLELDMFGSNRYHNDRRIFVQYASLMHAARFSQWAA